MAANQKFGGDWTKDKLDRLRKYLQAYITIFTRNTKASYFRTVYIDAFAGSGVRASRTPPANENILLELQQDADAQKLLEGSPQVALSISPPFDRYVFIDSNEDHLHRLSEVIRKFPALEERSKIIPGDANVILQSLCRNSDWKKERAVAFLDPYGMQVEWSTIEAIAATRAIDMWLLFPLGQGVNRLLPRKSLPGDAWGKRLTQSFGTEDWQTIFYSESLQIALFDSDPGLIKDTNFDRIAAFFNQRLADVFAAVAPNPLPLRNSKNVPIFLLCFAAGNPKGAKTAIKIANNILRR